MSRTVYAELDVHGGPPIRVKLYTEAPESDLERMERRGRELAAKPIDAWTDNDHAEARGIIMMLSIYRERDLYPR